MLLISQARNLHQCYWIIHISLIIKIYLSENFKKYFIFLILIFFTESCVDRINFDIGEPTSTLVIEGQISDQPGPHTIKVSKAFDIESKFSAKIPVTVKELAISDDAGNREELVEVSKGIY